MALERKWIRLAAAAAFVMALGLVLWVAAPRSVSAFGGQGASGGHGGCMGQGEGDGLADALGITSEELADARQEAFEAAVDQAVDDDLLTETQAERLRDFGGRMGRFSHGGFLGHIGGEVDQDALLAEALDIGVDELEAARETAYEAGLAAAVEDDRLTDEQADRMRAARALQSFMAEQGVRDRARAVVEDAVDDAVEAGVITEEQADDLRDGPGMRLRPFGGDLHHGGRGFHGFRGSRSFGDGGFHGSRFGGRFFFNPPTKSDTPTTSTL